MDTMKSLQERVNPLYKEIELIGAAFQRALYLREEWKKDVEIMKEKLLQAEQRLAKSEHDMALKAMEVKGVRIELHRAWIKLDEVSSSAVEAERCIDGLQNQIHEASSMRSELEERVFELVEGAKVTSEKAVEEYKKYKAFKDEVTESALKI